jgi:peptidyl-prolyl cis-trans isomerase B (cyclophilin B)
MPDTHLSLPAVSRSLTVAAACLALLLTACGGSDKPKAAQSTAAPAEATAAAAAALDENHCTPAKNPGEQKRPKLKQPTETLDASHTYVATVDTNCGAFEITLDAKRAPKTGGSFKYLADQGFYDGLLIHRIVPGFVFQGGDPLGTGNGGPGYQVVEAPPKTLKYVKYVVAMAKAANDPVGASGSQFFVVTGKDGEQLTPDYALLGEVTSGQDVADKIGAIITDPRSDFPDAPVLINSIKVAES